MDVDTILKKIEGADDKITEFIIVPEWDGAEFSIRTMSGATRDIWEQNFANRTKGGNNVLENIRADLISKTAYNDKGEVVFADANRVKMLGTKSSIVLDRLFVIAQKVNAIGTDVIEELEGN